jgi:hypothetical protein
MLGEVTGPGEDREEWAPLAANIDEERFNRGRIGPYRIGMSLRATALGEIVIAIAEGFSYVVELDLFDLLLNTQHAGPEGTLMLDLAQATAIDHPGVAKIVGAGIESGVPYVVRRHRLGRTLAELTERRGPLPLPVAAGVLFTLATTLADLAEGGPAAGAWSLGGFDARDVFLGFDGRVSLVGVGLQRVRIGAEDPIARDFASLLALAKRLIIREEEGETLAASVEAAADSRRLAEALRRGPFRESLARRTELLGCTLRERFEDAMREERAFFGLAPLQ